MDETDPELARERRAARVLRALRDMRRRLERAERSRPALVRDVVVVSAAFVSWRPGHAPIDYAAHPAWRRCCEKLAAASFTLRSGDTAIFASGAEGLASAAASRLDAPALTVTAGGGVHHAMHLAAQSVSRGECPQALVVSCYGSERPDGDPASEGGALALVLEPAGDPPSSGRLALVSLAASPTLPRGSPDAWLAAPAADGAMPHEAIRIAAQDEAIACREVYRAVLRLSEDPAAAPVAIVAATRRPAMCIVVGPVARQAATSARSAGLDTLELARIVAGTTGWSAGEIDPGANLFRRGLDSVQAAAITAAIERRLGLRLERTLLFEHPTLDALSAHLQPRSGTGEPIAPPEAAEGRSIVSSGAVEGRAFPLTRGQEALWILYRIAETSAAYHVRCALHVSPDVAVDALARAVADLGRRHPILRVRMLEQGGAVVQQVDQNLALALEVAYAASGAGDLDAWIRAASLVPFDLRTGPPARAALRLTHDRRDAVLVLAFHHIVSDFLSLRLIVSELDELYRARLDGRDPPFAPDVALFRLAMNEQTADPAATERRCDEWRALLPKDLPVLRFPRSAPQTGAVFHEGRELRWQFDGRIPELVTRYASDRAATPFQVMLCAYARLLMTHAEQADVLVGVTADLREDDSQSVGYFVNPVPIWFARDAARTWDGFLDAHRPRIHAALRLRDVPFPALVEHLAPPRHPFVTPVFQTMFTWLPYAREERREPAQLVLREWDPAGDQPGPATHDLVLMVAPAQDGWRAVWAYKPSAVDGARVASMAREYQTVVEAMTRGELLVPAAAVTPDGRERLTL